MIRTLTSGLGVLLTLLPALALPAESITGIHVSGVGEVKVVPDMARLTLEVRREGPDAAALKTELDEVTAGVLALARQMQIPERHVTAAAVNIHPRYRPDEQGQEPDGVVAIRTIEVTVEDLEKLGLLINGALEQGANGVRDVQLDASNRRDLENQALDLAIDNAVAEARRMAERFQVELGPLKDASVSSNQVYPMMRMEAMVDQRAANDSFAPGEMTIRRDVQATFSIRP